MSKLKVKANKLTEWVFKVPTFGGADKAIAVEVRLIAKESGLMLRAICQDNLIESIDDSDIDRLHARVDAALNALDMGDRIEWQDYIKIQVCSGRDDLSDALYGDKWRANESVDVRSEFVKYGLHPVTQEPYILDRYGYPRKAVIPVSYFQGKPWDTEQGWKSAYIPATPENIAAIEDVCSRLGVLKERLVHVLSQGNIQATLLNITNALPLLESKPAEALQDSEK
jgi:hypothetical protein